MKIGIVASVLGGEVREAPRLARLRGFDGLLFDACSAQLSLPELSASGRRELLRLIGTENCQLLGLRADLGPLGLAPGADVDRALEHLERAMQVAAAMAAPMLCVDLGPLPPPAQRQAPRPQIRPEDAGLIILPGPARPQPLVEPEPAAKVDPGFISQVDQALVELGRRADRYSVSIALRSDLSSLGALERALSAAGCPWFGVDLDPVAILRDEWVVDEVFSRLGAMIHHVRGRDATLGEARRTRPAIIGQGSTDWGNLLSSLDEAGYHGWLTLDPVDLTDRASAAVAGLAHLRGRI
jgi:sugar phosphate isomerase/epimerase